jgi:hypothetical protein
MKPEMRQTLAREPFPEKIRKVGQLIRLAKTFRHRSKRPLARNAPEFRRIPPQQTSSC